MQQNLYAFLQQGFARRLSDPCLLLQGAAPISYGELDQLSARYAGVLAALGLQRGDRLVAQVDKSPAALALYLACLRRGVIYLPLNTAYTAAEVDYFLGDAGPKLLVCRSASLPQLEPAAARQGVLRCLTLDEGGDQDVRGCDDDRDGTSLAALAATAAALPALEAGEPDDVVAMIYTSGTTGRSKGAMLTFRNLASNVRALHEIWGWRKDDVLLHALPIFHVHGLFVALHCALLGGSPILFHRRFDVDDLRRDLRRATVLMGVPTFYTRLLACEDFTAGDCAGMRLFISGSAPLLPETFAAFQARTGQSILERYGMTEAGMITSNPLNGPRIAGTVGYALPGVGLRIVDDAGQSLPTEQIGQLEIRGENVFAGYWRMPERTAAEFREDGYFRTGDLGALSADGRLTLVGRARDLIISGGYNIYPKEIEVCLDELPGVLESAVIGVPHADLGEAAIALLVTDGTGTFEESAALDRLASRLARFKLPRRLLCIDELPRNAMGKVQKQLLREIYANALN